MDLSKVKLNDDQQYAYNRMIAGNNIFISGRAGTGKSFLINYFLQKCKEELKLNVLVCAPTGISASLIDGATLHSTFGIPIGPVALDPDRIPDILKYANVILIDEISMCRMDVFDYIIKQVKMAEKRRSRPIRIITVGDFYQLPPVLTRSDKKVLKAYYNHTLDYSAENIRNAYAFQSKFWDFEKIELNKVMRQDDANFVDALQKVRYGKPDGVTWIKEHSAKSEIPNAIWLCPKKKDASRINSSKLEELDKSTERVFKINYTGYENLSEDDKQNLMADETLTLRKGARVIATVNTGLYKNGSIGTVVDFTEKSVVVVFDHNPDKKVLVDRATWDVFKHVFVTPEVGNPELETTIKASYHQIPLRLAWALTIHKSQGQTFPAANIHTDTWAAGQLYTALTRVPQCENIFISDKINLNNLIASDDVIMFNCNKNYKYRW